MNFDFLAASFFAVVTFLLLGLPYINGARREKKFQQYLSTLPPEQRELAIYGWNLRQ